MRYMLLFSLMDFFYRNFMHFLLSLIKYTLSNIMYCNLEVSILSLMNNHENINIMSYKENNNFPFLKL